MLSALPLLAAEDDSGDTAQPENPPAEGTTTAETDTPTLDDLTPPVSEDPDDENFVPSIRITEDLPVAFPVDI